jgi:hypothetical protein
MTPETLTFDEFARRYCERQVNTPPELKQTIEIHCGIVHIMRQSTGTTLIVRDYDTDGSDDGLKYDKDGGAFTERKYVSKEKP